MNAFIAIDRKLSIPEVRDAIRALSLPEGELTAISLRVYGGGLWEVVCDAEGSAPVPFNNRHRETFWLWEGEDATEATNAAAWLLKS
jgi:hypothetical protein